MGQIACYCRVSTAEQNLERQLDATTDYAQSRLGAPLAAIEIFATRAPGRTPLATATGR